MIFSMFFQTQRSTLGALTLDVLLKEELTLPSEVTQYPVEDGGPEISDHITQGTEKLTISGSVSSANSEALEFARCSSKMVDALETLRTMHKERATITVVTGLGVYEDMGLNGVIIARNSGVEKGGAWLDVDANLIKVNKVSLETADLPPEQVDPVSDGGKTKGKSGSTEKKAGHSTPTEPTKANNGSAASKLHDKLGMGAYTGLTPPT
jgi:hypothetical protein